MGNFKGYNFLINITKYSL